MDGQHTGQYGRSSPTSRRLGRTVIERIRQLAATEGGGRLPTSTAERSERTAAAGPLDVRVLGPLRVSVAGEALRLGGPKPQTVFAMLVAAAGRAVPADALVDGLWGEEPPASARGTLQSHVSKLRSALGDHIVWESGSYRLEAARECVDAWRFEDTVAAASDLLAADPHMASRRLQEVLSLWRGRPYAGLWDCEPLEAEARRLEELRLRAVEDRIAADLELGRHAELVGELDVLTAEHPLRERLRAQQMVALYRGGRQADALRVYDRLRVTLVEELGIDPSTELRGLQQRVLNQDPTLERAAATGAGELAFLFTDIEDSTPLWESDPEAMAAAVAIQDRVITEAAEAAGGRVVARTGDAIDTVFTSVDAAVAAAIDAQRSLRAADWGDHEPLRVRMAVDVGEVEEREGRHYGPVLNRLGRILAAGHGGQVLLSADAAEGLSGTEAFEVRPLGEYRFKGIGAPQRVFQLVGRELDEEFPPLRLDRPGSISRDPVVAVRGYELRDELGAGDFGLVYRAYQASVGREVAVKVIRPEYANQPAFIRRFEAEAQFIARLEHPHIVALYDFWRDPGGAYLVMPFLRGGCLADALRRGPWNVGPALRLLDQVGSALSYAHRQGIVHRDVKPGNVLLDEDGNAYLSDFGIATRLADDAGRLATTSHAYVPPEELRGEPLTARSDLFSFGVLTFELLTGVHLTGRDLPALSDARSDLPAELGEVLRAVTDDRPDERYERVEDYLRALRQALGADVTVATVEPPVSPTTAVRNPYKGLRAFQETDAADFYGRESLVDELLQAVSQRRLVAVVGASGSGKSSAVRAGLVPALRAGRLPGSRGWLVADMFPGSYPFEELEAALLRVAVEDPGGLIEDLRGDERGLLRVTKNVLPRDDSELVLLIDQFEELFSLVDDEDTRRLLLDSLRVLVEDERSRVRVVLTMRADFLDRPLEYPGFGNLVKEALVPVTPPTEESLGLAISRPARSVGIDLEPGLIGEIVTDVQDQPGGLPLLQYALTELFSRRDDGRLTIAAYRESGGVVGALGRRAEELYQGLSLPGREVAHQLFLRLVTIDEETDDTRRRVSQGELDGLDVDPQLLADVLQQYASYRLLTFDRDATTRVPTVEVAHEALIREWDRLRGWIEDARGALILHRRLQSAVREWVDSDRDPSFLLRGGRLEQAERWAQEGGIVISREEDEYLTESRQRWDEEEADRRRRRRAVVGSLAAALVVVALLAVVAVTQWRTAEAETRVANERRLAGAAMTSLEEDPERSILLALEAARLARDARQPLLPETLAALHAGTQTSRLELRIEGGHAAVAVSPDGALIATDVLDHGTSWPTDEVVLWDASTGDEVRRLTGAAPVLDVAFSPTEDLLAVGYQVEEGAETPPIVVWDASTGAEVARLPVPPHEVPPTSVAWQPLDWSPDGRSLAVGSWDGTAWRMTVWEVASEERIATFTTDGEFSFFDEGTLLITGPGLVMFHDVGTGEETDRLETPGTHALFIAADVDRDLLVTGDPGTREVQAWDLTEGTMVWSQPHPSASLQGLHADLGLVLVSGNEGEVSVYRIEDGTELHTLTGHTGAVWAAAFDPTAERAISVGGDGEIRIWDISTAGPPDLGMLDIGPHAPASLGIAPDATEVAIASDGGDFVRVDLRSGAQLDALTGQQIDWHTPAAISYGWDRMAWVDGEGQGWVRELDPGADASPLPACAAPRAVSSDGSRVLVDGVTLCPREDAPGDAELRSRVIDLESGEELLDLGPRPLLGPGNAFNPGGSLEADRYVAANIDAEVVEIHDLSTGELVNEVRIEGDIFLDAAFDPTGTYLAVGTQHGRSAVYDFAGLVAGTPPADAAVFDATVDTGGVPGVALSADGVLVTSGFASLRLWDIDDGELLVEISVAIQIPPFAAFSPDGDHLHYFDEGYVLRRYPLDSDELVELAESRVTRDLTEDECRRFLEPETC